MLTLISSQLAGLFLAATGVWPLQPDPTVVRGFDPPSVAWAAGHRGVDLAGTVGQPVRAAFDGTVSFSGRIAGRGVVVVSHGATRTTYEPVRGSLPVGAPLVAGRVLGTLELFGSHCFPRSCLHWGLVEGDRHYLDPLTLIGCAPRSVRLLPLDRPLPAAEAPCASVPTAGQQLVAAVVRLVDELADRPAGAGRW